VLSSVSDVLTATEIAGYVGAGLSGAAYVPQISHLIRARCSAGISRLAFGVWLLATCLVMARAIALQAGVFIVLGVIQIAATAIIVFYATRYRDMSCPDHLPATWGTQAIIGPTSETESKSGWHGEALGEPATGRTLRAGKPSLLRTRVSRRAPCIDLSLQARNDRSENLSRTVLGACTFELPGTPDSVR
jgi:uncharacterized protein with PQ loop repeat